MPHSGLALGTDELQAGINLRKTHPQLTDTQCNNSLAALFEPPRRNAHGKCSRKAAPSSHAELMLIRWSSGLSWVLLSLL